MSDGTRMSSSSSSLVAVFTGVSCATELTSGLSSSIQKWVFSKNLFQIGFQTYHLHRHHHRRHHLCFNYFCFMLRIRED